MPSACTKGGIPLGIFLARKINKRPFDIKRPNGDTHLKKISDHAKIRVTTWGFDPKKISDHGLIFDSGEYEGM